MKRYLNSKGYTMAEVAIAGVLIGIALLGSIQLRHLFIKEESDVQKREQLKNILIQNTLVFTDLPFDQLPTEGQCIVKRYDYRGRAMGAANTHNIDHPQCQSAVTGNEYKIVITAMGAETIQGEEPDPDQDPVYPWTKSSNVHLKIPTLTDSLRLIQLEGHYKFQEQRGREVLSFFRRR